MPSAGGKIGGQPRVRRDAVHLKRAEDGIEYAGQPRSVHAAERELAADRDSAQTTFGGVVVHGNGRVVHEHGQAVAVAHQGVQGAALHRALRERVQCFFRRRGLDRGSSPVRFAPSRKGATTSPERGSQGGPPTVEAIDRRGPDRSATSLSRYLRKRTGVAAAGTAAHSIWRV